MRYPSRSFAAAFVVACLVASPTAAQSHRTAITVAGGGSIHGDLGPFSSVSAQFQPGWITGLQLETWLGSGRAGIRLDGLWTQRELDQAGASRYNVFAAETDLLVRFRRARPGNVFVPFAGIGAGATHYSGVASTGTLLGGLYGDPVYRAHVTASLGLDLLASGSRGLRLEVGDQIVLPSIGQSPQSEGLPMVHNLVVKLGFQMRLGRLAGDARADAAPAPEPEPMPAPDEPAEAPAADADPDHVSRTELETRLAAKEREIARLQARIDSLQRGAPTPEPMPGPDAAEARYTVQIGSFVEAATADRWVQRLRDRGLPVWRTDTEVQGRSVSRVRVGATATESEAQTLADVLKRDYGWPVWVDQVAEGETVPANALQRTRDVLYR